MNDTAIDMPLAAEVIATEWPEAIVIDGPHPLTGGFWASMQRISLEGQPPGIPAELVFRVAPVGPMGAKELAVQRSVEHLGYPTPAVRLAGSRGGSTWSVMDFAPGSPPLDGLDGVAALRHGPAILRRLPAQLAGPLAQLHALDPSTITAAVKADAPSVAWTVDDLLAHFAGAAVALGHPELASIIDRVAESRPAEGTTVVCHGDYHPFNLLVADDGTATVLDWTGAILADPAYDLAFTTLLLENPPLHAPGALKPVIGAVGRRLARKFIAAYRSAAPAADLSAMEWYRALHGVRVLVELASITHRDPEAAVRHPFTALRSAAEGAVQLAAA